LQIELLGHPLGGAPGESARIVAAWQLQREISWVQRCVVATPVGDIDDGH
jgi:hypothetical protein